MQQAVGVHLAQAVHHLGEDLADMALGQHPLAGPVAVVDDQLLQAATTLVGHDHVDGLVGPEEVDHTHHIGVDDPRQGPPLLEEALQTVAIRGQIPPHHLGHQLPGRATNQRAGQVFLDGHRLPMRILGEINH